MLLARLVVLVVVVHDRLNSIYMHTSTTPCPELASSWCIASRLLFAFLPLLILLCIHVCMYKYRHCVQVRRLHPVNQPNDWFVSLVYLGYEHTKISLANTQMENKRDFM